MNIIQQKINELMQSNDIQANIIKLVKSVADRYNLNIYIVGGFVRDLYLGKRSNDLDFMVANMPSETVINTVKTIIQNNPNYLNKLNKIIRQNQEKRRKTQDIVSVDSIDDIVRQCGGALCAAILVQNETNECFIEIYYNTMTVMINFFGVKVEFAHARSEEYLITRLKNFRGISSRRPTVKPITDITEDIRRRDFTINALMISLKDMQVIDEVGGLKDLENGIIRVVSGDTIEEKAKIFEVDPLRIIRAARFTMLRSNIDKNLRFRLDPETLEAMKKAMQTNRVVAGFFPALDTFRRDYSSRMSMEKAREIQNKQAQNMGAIIPGAFMPELKKILLSENPSIAINILGEVGFLKYISLHLQKLYDDQKKLKQLATYYEIPKYALHKEIWSHTMEVLDFVSISEDIKRLIDKKVRSQMPGASEENIQQAIENEINKYLLILRTSALFHDVGKIATRKLGSILCPKCGNKVIITNIEDKEVPFICSSCNLYFKIPNLIEWMLQEAYNKRNPRNQINKYQPPERILFACDCPICNKQNWLRVPQKPGKYINKNCETVWDWRIGNIESLRNINTKVTFHDHERHSANIVRLCLASLQFTRSEIEEIVHLVFYHGMKFADTQSVSTHEISDRTILSRMSTFARHQKGRDTEEDSDIRRLMVIELQKADIKPNKRIIASIFLDEILKRYEMLRNRENTEDRRIREKILDGNDIMYMFGLEGGPWLQKILEALDKFVKEEEDNPTQLKQSEIAYQLLKQIIQQDFNSIHPLNKREFDILLDKYDQDKLKALEEWIETKYNIWIRNLQKTSFKYSWIKIAKKYEFI